MTIPPRFFTEIPYLPDFSPTTWTVPYGSYICCFFDHRINGSCWFHLVSLSHPTVADKIVGLKSVAAYRSGLEINTNVTRNEAEEGLVEVLKGEDHDLRWIFILLLYSPRIFSNLSVFTAGSPVRIKDKSFIDYLFVQSLEIALQFNLPVQLHTG